MTDSLEQWLQSGEATRHATSNVPRGLYDRLKYVAAIVSAAENVSNEPTLLYRKSDSSVHAHCIGKALLVGREAPADVIVPDPRLSRRHFQITPFADTARFEDLKSKNGTRVNGNKVARCELRDGDVIEAGHHVFVFLKKFDMQ